MKPITHLILLFALTFLLASCGKVPVAKFEPSTTTPNVGEEVSFENNTYRKNTCEWDFGDGTTSSEWSPKHTYNSEGVYTAKLEATNKKGNAVSTKPVTITVTKSQAQIDSEASSALIVQTWSLDSMTLDENNGPTHINYPTSSLWGGTTEYLWIFTNPNVVTTHRDGVQESSGTWSFTSGTDLLLDNQLTVDVIDLSATKFAYSRPNGNDPNYTETWFFTVQ